MDRRTALLSFAGLATIGFSSAPKGEAEELHGIPSNTQLSAEALPVPRSTTNSKEVVFSKPHMDALKAIFDRLIPRDALGPSASEAGCIEFLLEQLSGEYGEGAAYYLSGPMTPDNERDVMGGPQFLQTPRQRYEEGLKELDNYVKRTYGRAFPSLSVSQMDTILTDLEAGTLKIGKNFDGQAFFELMLQNVREGYLADPLYGGNKDMVGWKMIGFPGARYDYRPYIDRPNQNLRLLPVSLIPDA
ncbi:gluconate 2-dehydrogenase subunit 3 family protein [Gluconobacter cerinus]|uniref:Gluconate 2-dehydrogenase n=1 Tax=Gluconobacter cerinus TaxID=38307 RepID=A0A1B6VIR8_9PROT|nr:gluconate 2-dehydrogenase subunit 3 family protein [Gluconobacter cerinus]OAJ67104.1 gluconate 2-dehydrogenase [Gluconobacter cerinus]